MRAHRTVSDFTARVHAIVRCVPRGQVVSYGGVAAILGHPRAARAVGRALCALPDGSDVPWWRVINRNAEISIKCVDHGPALQRALLEREGVRFGRSGRTDWRRFGWDGSGVPPGLRMDQRDEEGDDGDAPRPSRTRRASAKSAKQKDKTGTQTTRALTAPRQRTRKARAEGTPR
jgi:methylated-DNA-protein-cysteine methyltransferase-like protein